ncbi:peroxide stress protein YaaA [Polynucleobacter sp. 15G-AUS-farblos]|uniref:peroxide stress protein YaaA n=1 Tax=Polynucleobacter sp. 15G-AUS-farblos TaxID=2689094 RepID=UPI001C0BAA1C|nr:peroxide stress protein YaaA [Polynucleobacter sp. 15G-AUS-farblos]MBU3583071.1 peroxide stress protein YaaA [Polynucleobacter sp. 15G-AUS-farblos]
MLIVLSPAKSLDYKTPVKVKTPTLPEFVSESAKLIADLKKLAPQDIAKLMGLSDQLAVLNVGRYRDWSKKFTEANSKPAIYAFDGDVYDGFDVKTLDAKTVAFAQEHIRILSGLYGALRPLDLMQAYRLEMGTSFKNPRGKDLYAFWGTRVTDSLKKVLEKDKKPALLNLASEEYFKVLQPKDLGCPVISPVFQDGKDGKFKIISFYAKRARGLMARYVVENRISDPADLKGFNLDGYRYYAAESKPDKPIFRRAERK